MEKQQVDYKAAIEAGFAAGLLSLREMSPEEKAFVKRRCERWDRTQRWRDKVKADPQKLEEFLRWKKEYGKRYRNSKAAADKAVSA